MDHLTQTHLTTLRELLSDRLKALRDDVGAAEQARREPVAAGEHEVADRKDDAAQQQFVEVSVAQEERDLDEFAQVEAALQRLDSASYGDCIDCAEPIPLKRLRVQPAALRCAACQSGFEHARGRVKAI